MLADRLGVEVLDLQITASAEVDVRGCLLVDPSVPAGFQRMSCELRLRVPESVRPEQLRLLMETAERCCVVLQTLNRGTEVRTDWQIDQDLDADAGAQGSGSAQRASDESG
jgi:hypothetical protein